MIAILSTVKRHATAIATVILLGQIAIYYSGSAKETIPAVAPWNQFPGEVEDWKGSSDQVIEQDVLNALQPDDYLARTYSSSSGPYQINLFVGYFNSRRDGRAPHSPQWCLPGAGWKSLSSKTISIAIPNAAESLPANEYLIEKGMNKELVLYWYHQGGRTVANEVVAQIYSLPDLIFHSRTDTALVRIIVPIRGDDVNGARTVGIGFARAAYPLIRKHIT
jgi:EpsI family protein